MRSTNRTRRTRNRGSALLATFAVLMLISVAAVSYVDRSTQTVRIANRQAREVQGTHLCEAGVQAALQNLWRPFKVEQTFDDLDTALSGASENNPRAATSGEIDGVGRYSCAAIRYTPSQDGFSRTVTFRSVGWLDTNGNGALDPNEMRKTVDVTTVFELTRSQVFDYTYFVNNRGWMKGFRPEWLIANGDMRSNGNFDFLRNDNGDLNTGSGTMNGSVVATLNDKLDPPVEGLITFDGSTENAAPLKWTQANYNTQAANNRYWRQGYDPALHGARGTSTYNQWRDFIFDGHGSMQTDENQNNRWAGAVLADVMGARGWDRTSLAQNPTFWNIDSNPTKEIVMPDLSNLDYYRALSQNYRNQKATYGDGTNNTNYNRPAYVERWDGSYRNPDNSLGRWECVTAPVEKDANGNPKTDSQGRPKYIDTNGDGRHDWRDSLGVCEGTITLVGTSSNPIRVHGPVTFTEDVVMKGFVQGQGTFYTGRNVHIVGNLRYVSEPDFRRTGGRTTFAQIENYNEKQDFLGLAARASIILGNPTTFTNTTLQYMRPPWTKGRYDDYGNWIPPYDATVVDGKKVDNTNRKRYESTLTNTQMNSISDAGVGRVDAILYTNFVGGGNVGTGGGGFTLNGTIISKDEAIVTWSVPIRMNYDHRIRERTATKNPLIDIVLPRSPRLLRTTWQDRGFGKESN